MCERGLVRGKENRGGRWVNAMTVMFHAGSYGLYVQRYFVLLNVESVSQRMPHTQRAKEISEILRVKSPSMQSEARSFI